LEVAQLILEPFELLCTIQTTRNHSKWWHGFRGPELGLGSGRGGRATWQLPWVPWREKAWRASERADASAAAPAPRSRCAAIRPRSAAAAVFLHWGSSAPAPPPPGAVATGAPRSRAAAICCSTDDAIRCSAPSGPGTPTTSVSLSLSLLSDFFWFLAREEREGIPETFWIWSLCWPVGAWRSVVGLGWIVWPIFTVGLF
jgi:hypothetical protein